MDKLLTDNDLKRQTLNYVQSAPIAISSNLEPKEIEEVLNALNEMKGKGYKYVTTFSKSNELNTWIGLRCWYSEIENDEQYQKRLSDTIQERIKEQKEKHEETLKKIKQLEQDLKTLKTKAKDYEKQING